MATQVRNKNTRQREIGLVPHCAAAAIRIVGPFSPDHDEAMTAITMDGKQPPKGYKWMHAYWGEITRAKDCIVQAPVERTFTYYGIP